MQDVLVIGAGLSGLTAAWRLQEAGLAVTVLEARERTGGRTVSPPGSTVDLGASWVWDTEAHVHALLRELGVETFPHHRDGLDLYDDGRALQRGRLPGSHVKERRLRGGAQSVTLALAERVRDVHLEQPARRVTIERAQTGEPSLRVDTDQGQRRARHVIAALPPALLAQRVQLPEVAPDRLALLRRTPTWMADIAKVVAEYPERFWREDGLSGRAASALGPMMELHDLSGPDGHPPALFGFAPRQLATAGWRERLVPQLVKLFGPRAASPSALHTKAWWEEEWTFAGQDSGDPRLLGHPTLREPLLDGRLHLVSTETSGVSPGHMDGAIERAEHVARQLQQALAQRPC